MHRDSLKTFIAIGLLTTAFLSGCNDGSNPVQPQPDNEPTGPAYQQPEVFPLAEGARWEYSISSSSFTGNYYDSTYRKFWISGYFSVEVVDETVLESARQFTVSCHYHQDSLFKIEDNVLDYNHGVYNDTIVTSDSPDTTYPPYFLNFSKDTLRYGDSDILIPVEPERGSSLNLKLFGIPGVFLFSFPLPFRVGGDSLIKFQRVLGGGEEEYVAQLVRDTGPVFIQVVKRSTSANYPSSGHFRLNLINYTPGTPVIEQ